MTPGSNGSIDADRHTRAGALIWAKRDVGLLAGVVTIVVFSLSTLALTAARSAAEGRPKHSVQTPILVNGKWCAAL